MKIPNPLALFHHRVRLHAAKSMPAPDASVDFSNEVAAKPELGSIIASHVRARRRPYRIPQLDAFD